ncbi:MAG TPA: ABC transporter ATP-binding protein [Rhodopila sp.]|uniref:ABC transporter ATP-binding protein n=1 Tax=Rhodopila sp. TaxID=2480087 RepID=UPI002C89141B|nr:ABC transporter ATP-binding protein [Rhodopila sp.]HVY16337.1 ABC transporter ATP-binding protein [Rhodopila sp.]
MADNAVELIGLSKLFADIPAVDRIDLTVATGEFLTLLGPSGCGKTTTLNMIAGFLTPDAGTIRLAGRSVDRLPSFRRDIGIVFQDYALFPHMSVADNVAFGLKMRRVAKPEITRRVAEALDLVHLSGFGERRPMALSGGQRQRVALARALVIQPTVLLLDEPLSNLDLKLREEMRLEITTLQRRLGITMIMVTHDQGEALAVSDRIAIMNKGRIEQLGDAHSVYENPGSRFVADFIGQTNFVPGTVREGTQAGGECTVTTEAGNLTLLAPQALQAGAKVEIAVRPERLRFATAADAAMQLSGTVLRHVYLGDHTETHVRTTAGSVVVVRTGNHGEAPLPAENDTVALAAAAADCRVFTAPA